MGRRVTMGDGTILEEINGVLKVVSAQNQNMASGGNSYAGGGPPKAQPAKYTQPSVMAQDENDPRYIEYINNLEAYQTMQKIKETGDYEGNETRQLQDYSRATRTPVGTGEGIIHQSWSQNYKLPNGGKTIGSYFDIKSPTQRTLLNMSSNQAIPQNYQDPNANQLQYKKGGGVVDPAALGKATLDMGRQYAVQVNEGDKQSIAYGVDNVPKGKSQAEYNIGAEVMKTASGRKGDQDLADNSNVFWNNQQQATQTQNLGKIVNPNLGTNNQNIVGNNPSKFPAGNEGMMKTDNSTPQQNTEAELTKDYMGKKGVVMNDNMKFSEAFREAHTKQGNDGLFWWRGKAYATGIGKPSTKQSSTKESSKPKQNTQYYGQEEIDQPINFDNGIHPERGGTENFGKGLINTGMNLSNNQINEIAKNVSDVSEITDKNKFKKKHNMTDSDFERLVYSKKMQNQNKEKHINAFIGFPTENKKGGYDVKGNVTYQ